MARGGAREGPKCKQRSPARCESTLMNASHAFRFSFLRNSLSSVLGETPFPSPLPIHTKEGRGQGSKESERESE